MSTENKNNRIFKSHNENVNSTKLELDKYYTPVDLAEDLINKSIEFIGIDNISEFVEPSAGNGSFSNILSKIKPTVAIDIEPECKDIIEADYLSYKIEYKKGRCVIGNPPFGSKMLLARDFFNKSIMEGDYVAFILPISQIDNDVFLYKFDLIHSEDLGEVVFSDRPVHCCFNIYRRPKGGKLNKTPKYDLPEDIVLILDYRKGKDMVFNDRYIRVCSRGSRSGEVINGDFMSNEIWVDVKETPIKDKLIEAVHNYNYWEEPYANNTISARLPKWRFCQYLINVIEKIK